tara:strand:- start:1655 stop:2098 length:444 start_codon:yes stop_codon:yes gene_type:complete
MIKKIIFTIISLIFSHIVFADVCSVEIQSSDMMRYDKKIINVNHSCKSYKIFLKHSGKLPKNVMGHNLVIIKTDDLNNVTSKISMAHGLNKGYLPDMSEVIFKSEVIGGGEETILEINPSKLTKGVDYTFFCSFPGHFAIMKGKIKI